MTRWGRKGNKRKRQRESQLVQFFFVYSRMEFAQIFYVCILTPNKRTLTLRILYVKSKVVNVLAKT